MSTPHDTPDAWTDRGFVPASTENHVNKSEAWILVLYRSHE